MTAEKPNISIVGLALRTCKTVLEEVREALDYELGEAGLRDRVTGLIKDLERLTSD